MSERNTGDILLELLEFVPDASTLEILLEPANLLQLLQNYGYDTDVVRQELQAGKKPGEFLLEILHEEPDVDQLLHELGNPQPSAKNTNSAPKVVPAPTEEEPNNNLFGQHFIWPIIIAIALTAVLPALAVTGFTPVSFINSTSTATMIALVGGAIGGALSDSTRKFSIKGLLLGATYCVSALWAAILYTQARSTIFRLEMAIPLLLAGVPTAVLYAVLNKVMGSK